MAEHLLLLPIFALEAGNISGESDLIRKLKKVLLLCREALLRNQRKGQKLPELSTVVPCLGPAEPQQGHICFYRPGNCPTRGTFLPKPTTKEETKLHKWTQRQHQDFNPIPSPYVWPLQHPVMQLKGAE